MLLKVINKFEDENETTYLVQDQQGEMFYLTENVTQDFKDLQNNPVSE